MSILKTIYLQHLNGAAPNATLDANGNMTVTGTVVASSSMGMRNRIINGDMRIDQRNAGASLTLSGGVGVYPVDRFSALASQSSKLSVQQNAGSVTPPAGFSHYLGVTSLSAYTSISTDLFRLFHVIEGYNIADLAWGTSSAKSITMSFWVRSSLTGTFGGCLQNTSNNRAYAFTYTITATNTWEYKTITIPGETSGTWGSTNSGGIHINLDLGSGSTKQISPGSWQAVDANAATGCTSIVGTNGATWYMTGFQLEVGTIATPFERRLYGQELALCQRYYSKSYDIGTAPGTATQLNMVGGAFQGASGLGGAYGSVQFPVIMRTSPTVSLWDGAGTSNVLSYTYGSAGSGQSIANGGAVWGTGGAFNIGTYSFFFRPTGAQPSALAYTHYAASAEL